jgi:hypothetical protein
VSVEKLPLYVNVYPDSRATLTCAHCAVDAELEGARVTALFTERRAAPEPAGTTAIVWQTDLAPELVFVAARAQCMHLAAYGPRAV